MCVRKMFSASFVPQPVENNTFWFHFIFGLKVFQVKFLYLFFPFVSNNNYYYKEYEAMKTKNETGFKNFKPRKI